MANMGSRLRRARKAYQVAKGKKIEAVRVQQSYIDDFNKLKAMGGEPGAQRIMTSAGGRRRPASYATGWGGFVSYTEKRDRQKNYKGRWGGIRYTIATQYRPVGSYEGLLEQYRDKAISAEMGGLASAQAALAGVGPMDLSYVRSARGRSGSSKSKTQGTITGWDPNKKNDDGTKGGYIRTKGISKSSEAARASKFTTDYSNPDFKIKPTVRYAGLSPETIKAQQALSDADPEFGIVTFDVAGNISTAPSSGKINWDAMGIDSMSGERKKQIKSQLGDYYVRQGIQKEAENINKSEAALNKKIAEVNKQLGAINIFSAVQNYIKESERKKSLGKYENPEFGKNERSWGNYGTLNPKNAEVSKLEKQLAQLQKAKKDNLGRRSKIGNAVKSVGRNEFYKKVYDAGGMDDMTASMLLTSTLNENRDREIMIVEQKALEQKSVQSELNKLNRFERRLMKLDRNKSTSGKTTAWKDRRDKLYQEMRDNGIDVNDGVTIASALGLVKPLVTDKSDDFQRIKNEKNKLSLNISQNRTNEGNISFASDIKMAQVGKQEFEKLTGYDVDELESKGISAKSAMNMYYNEMNKLGLESNERDQKSYVYFDEETQSVKKKKYVDAWYGNWLFSQGSDLQRGAEDIDLITGKKIDNELQSKLRGQKQILDKYDAWGNASKYIGDTVSSWKGETRDYYNKSYLGASVSDSTISKHWFGTDTVQGESFAIGAASQIGIRDYSKDPSGISAQADVKKIISTSQGYYDNLKTEHSKVEEQLALLQAQQEAKQSKHKEYRPLIDSKVKQSQTTVSVDKEFASELDKSSQELYDLNYQLAEKRVALEYYEKSMVKTERDIEQFKQQKKQLDFDIVQNSVSSGLINRIQKTAQPGRSKFRRNTGGKRTRTRGSSNRLQRRNTLGGLVT
jgi:hypothetical protein